MIAALAGLTDELGRLFDVALEVEHAGGLNDAWTKVLLSYDVAPVGSTEREAARARLHLARGALPAEVSACARVAVARFAARATEAGIDAARLVTAAAEIWPQIEPKYLEYATWRPKSMFAFAKQAAQAKARVASQRPPGGYVIRCSGCGGPRLGEALACRFCGKAQLGT